MSYLGGVLFLRHYSDGIWHGAWVDSGAPKASRQSRDYTSVDKTYEIRDPVHGFINLNDWEREIIDHPVFQRLRRIRQLGLTEMVYPGATHSRFEHSIGVMHTATRMFNEIERRYGEFLQRELRFTKGGLERSCPCASLKPSSRHRSRSVFPFWRRIDAQRHFRETL